jgi:predicted dehydrogenase
MTRRRAIVVGSGWGAHSARALARDPRTELVGIVGRGSTRSQQLADALGVEIAPTLAIALGRFEPDIVVLAVGERAHEPLAIEALERGADLLCAHPVAPSAAAVVRIADAARLQGRIARTDYTFRLRPELHALVDRQGRGELLRVSIDAPGRWLPIALDVAVMLAGRVSHVVAMSVVPVALAARAAATPAAFPPSLMLQHASGVVTSFVPFPHAPPGAPVRVRASWERAQTQANLPSSGATSLALRRGGVIERRILVEPTSNGAVPAAIGDAMQDLVASFVSAVHGQPDALATLDDEAHLRAVWAAVWSSARTGGVVEVEGDDRA